MAHDIFISHASRDKPVADAVCVALENAAIRCWIAPRDVQPGRSFAGEINRAIQHSKVMALIFSAHSNNSEQVLREVQLAVNSHLHIIQFRIEDVRLNDDLEYFLSTPHWLDALTPPLEDHIERLKTSIQTLLDVPAEQSATMAPSVSSSSDKREVSVTVPRKQEVSTASTAPSPRVNRGRKFVFAGAIIALMTAGVLSGWWFGIQQPRKEAERQRHLTEQKREMAEQERTVGEKKANANTEAERDRLAAQQGTGEEEEAKKRQELLMGVAAATTTKPFENSLGMKFVPVPIRGGPTSGKPVLFSVWETRVRDFAQFIQESGRDMKKGDVAHTLESDGKGGYAWKQRGGDWRDPRFPAEVKQTEDHPVVCVSWEDAVAFGEWLTKREEKAGRLPAEWSYRLPSDHEWSCAVGIGEQENASQTPEAKDGKIKKVYPWGKTWPPPLGAGNYCGEESRIGVTSNKSWPVIEGYRDGAPRTSAAGQYDANEHGLFDLGGNAPEWCEDEYKPSNGAKAYVLRGASWLHLNPDDLLASDRSYGASQMRSSLYGFRLVVAGSSQNRSELTLTQIPTAAPTQRPNAPPTIQASKEQPYVNSLGMKFVPVPRIAVLFDIWETRLKDFEAFMEATKYKTSEGMYSLEKNGWVQAGRTWKDPGFAQTGEHAVCGVSWQDAKAFCEWLTKEERKAGRLSALQSYRLPSDLEWSAAVGLEKESGSTPEQRNNNIKGLYPWGMKWPPPKGAGNYHPSLKVDAYEQTSPVGSFAANVHGIHDLGGNVWEACEDKYYETGLIRVARGASWRIGGGGPASLLSSFRAGAPPEACSADGGFRCVLVVESSR